MGAVTTPLGTEAESIFRDLGYDVEHHGGELRATRRWRTVYVTTAAPDEAPDHGEFRCFVARADRATDVRDELCRADHPYDWAVVAVGEDGYDVLHPDAGTLRAP
ncbi:DUF7116 family protein [Halosegnis marinus]|uniref:Uncharacterized protein n=1 Tax=Halosegnis marinus TaxID=3034023 RepID=A0ABD5ZKT8_9EURY|nr:hypothetical protein [Halosegnis sp. DT85]